MYRCDKMGLKTTIKQINNFGRDKVEQATKVAQDCH